VNAQLMTEKENTVKLTKQLETLSKEGKKKDEIMAKRSEEISVLKRKLEESVWENERRKLESKSSDYQLKLREEIRKEIEDEIIENFDLDQYNITSDDLRSAWRNQVKGVEHKGHPKVPKLDLKQIIADQLKQKPKAKSSGSSESSEGEVEVEESILEENVKFMFKGTPLVTDKSMQRRESLLNWKEHVLNILNESYKEDESSFKPKESSFIGGDEDLLNMGESPKEVTK
jgi:hypothetical protein